MEPCRVKERGGGGGGGENVTKTQSVVCVCILDGLSLSVQMAQAYPGSFFLLRGFETLLLRSRVPGAGPKKIYSVVSSA